VNSTALTRSAGTEIVSGTFMILPPGDALSGDEHLHAEGFGAWELERLQRTDAHVGHQDLRPG
jgi:hypothetical protein